MSDFSDPGTAERVKAAAHGAALLLVSVFVLYNTVVWWKRPSRRSAVNVVVYTLVGGFEVHHIVRHVKADQ